MLFSDFIKHRFPRTCYVMPPGCAKPICLFTWTQCPLTQIVWKSTTELGMGSARSNEHGLIIVARYSPMGSTGGTVSFLQNVVPSGALTKDFRRMIEILHLLSLVEKCVEVKEHKPSGDAWESCVFFYKYRRAVAYISRVSITLGILNLSQL